MAHADGDVELEYFNTVHEEDDHWRKLSSLPELCGIDGVAISGYRSTVSMNMNMQKTDINQPKNTINFTPGGTAPPLGWVNLSNFHPDSKNGLFLP